MITRAKNGIFKPKSFPNILLICEQISELATFQEALRHPEWKKAMNVEFQALLKNQTWDLVPYQEDMNHVAKADGSVDRFKARLVAKGFQQVAGIDFFLDFQSCS